MVTFSFEEFVFEPSSGELRNHTETVRLRPKTSDLLAFLIENRGKVVSSEAIFSAIWGETAVSTATLSQGIKELRRA